MWHRIIQIGAARSTNAHAAAAYNLVRMRNLQIATAWGEVCPKALKQAFGHTQAGPGTAAARGTTRFAAW